MDKYYDENKSGLYSLGFINTDFINELQQLSGKMVDSKLLDGYIQNLIDKNEVEFYEYKNGNPIKSRAFSTNAIIKVVNTGFKNQYNDNILAYYKKDKFNRWTGVFFNTEKELYNKLNTYSMGFIKFRKFDEAKFFINNLHEQLLPGEKWGFGSTDTEYFRAKTHYPILESYIKQVFSKLFIEHNDKNSKNFGKIVFSEDGNYCIFNSGLLTKFAKDVIILGDVYRKDGKFLAINNPRRIDSKVELTTKLGFSPTAIREWPSVIEFFKDINDIIFNTKIEIDMTEEKLRHSIVDGIDRNRFPEEYKSVLDKSQLPYLANKLEGGIKNALVIATRNYKYVVPQYRPPQNESEVGKIQFLMPIYLDGTYEKEADFALVLNRVGQYYIPETILNLSMAYNNARLICKPDDSWLNPDAIIEVTDDDDLS